MTSTRIARNSAYVLVGQGLAVLLSAGTFSIVARASPVATFGQLAAFYGLSQTLSVLLDFGASNYWTRALAQGAERSKYREVVLARSSQLTLLALVVLAGSSLGGHTIFGLAISVGVAATIYRLLLVPLRASLRLFTLGLFVALERAIALALSVALIFFSAIDARSFLLANVASAALASIAVLVSTRSFSLGSWSFGISRVFINTFRGTGGLGATSSMTALQSLDSLIIGSIGSSYVAGIYASVSRWTQPMSLLSSAVGQSVYADLSHSKSRRKALADFLPVLGLLCLAVIPALVVAAFAPQLVGLILGSHYEKASSTLRLLSFAVALSTLSNPITLLLQAQGDEKFTAVSVSIVIPLQLATMGIIASTPASAWIAAGVLFWQAALFITFSLRLTTWLRKPDGVERPAVPRT